MAASNGGWKMTAIVNVDEALKKRILDTHQEKNVKILDPNPLLHAIKDVIQHATEKEISVEGHAPFLEGHLRYDLQHFPYEAIKLVSCEFSCKRSATSTTSEVAIAVLQSLGNYAWEAKAVITLAAFAANYGSYFSISQRYRDDDTFSKSMAALQLSPDLLRQTPFKLKPKTTGVVEAIFALASCIVKVKAFQSQYAQHKMFASFVAAHEEDLAKAVYMSIHGTVACASILMKTVAFGNEYKPTTMEAIELEELATEIKNTRSALESGMKRREKHIESIILAEDYEKLTSLLKQEHTDNREILHHLLCWKQTQLTIYNCDIKTQEELKNLRGKYVLLYFSNLEYISEEEISTLSEKYDKKSTQYKIVWVPIVDESTSRNERIENKFKKMQDLMEWYSINDPWKLNKAVIKYVKEEWKFKGESEFVVLNPKGEFVISAAVNLFWFLEGSGFGEHPLKTIKLLQETIGSVVNDWIQADKLIILFGGTDMEWLKKFVDTAKAAEAAAKIEFVMMYVGKKDLKWAQYYQSNLKQLQEITSRVSGFGDEKHMSSFWATLQSIWLTKTTIDKPIVDSGTMDYILIFDATGEGWAAIRRGARPEMAIARGQAILDRLKEHRDWQALPAVDTPGDDHDCYDVAVSATTESTPPKVNCRFCNRAMQTFIAYRCCGRDH